MIAVQNGRREEKRHRQRREELERIVGEMGDGEVRHRFELRGS
jgi:hypothetical protein